MSEVVIKMRSNLYTTFGRIADLQRLMWLLCVQTESSHTSPTSTVLMLEEPDPSRCSLISIMNSLIITQTECTNCSTRE